MEDVQGEEQEAEPSVVVGEADLAREARRSLRTTMRCDLMQMSSASNSALNWHHSSSVTKRRLACVGWRGRQAAGVCSPRLAWDGQAKRRAETEGRTSGGMRSSSNHLSGRPPFPSTRICSLSIWASTHPCQVRRRTRSSTLPNSGGGCELQERSS